MIFKTKSDMQHINIPGLSQSFLISLPIHWTKSFLSRSSHSCLYTKAKLKASIQKSSRFLIKVTTAVFRKTRGKKNTFKPFCILSQNHSKYSFIDSIYQYSKHCVKKVTIKIGSDII